LGVGVKGLSNCGFTSVSDERWPCQTAVTYRAAFSFGRIVDELWGVIAILWVVCFATLFQQMIESPWDSVVFLVGFTSLGLASYRFLPSIVRATMPRGLHYHWRLEHIANLSGAGHRRNETRVAVSSKCG